MQKLFIKLTRWLSNGQFNGVGPFYGSKEKINLLQTSKWARKGESKRKETAAAAAAAAEV